MHHNLGEEGEKVLTEYETYYRFFRNTVLCGIACSLEHPVEWLINIHRVPGGSMTTEYYQEVERHIPRALIDIFEALHLELPRNADEILEMCDSHYPEGHLCRGYFEFLRQDIEECLEKVIEERE